MSETPSTEVNPRPENTKELADLIESLTVFEAGGESGYERSAEAMWKAAQAAFDYVARRVGATGFQASWAALRFYGEEMSIDGPFMMIQARDALYPQYDVPGKVQRFVDESKPWLVEQAKMMLATRADHAHPDVLAHWRDLAASDVTA